MYRLYLTGNGYHCKLVKDLLKDDEDIFFVNELKDADLLYAIYGPGINGYTLKYWLFSQKPILVHWIGKDTFLLDKTRKVKGFRTKISKLIKLNLLRYRNQTNTIKFISSAPWLAKEVEKLTNIKTDFLVLTSIESENLLKPNSERIYDFISYIPINDFEMYYGPDFLDIVESNPNRRFCIVCPDITDIKEWPFRKFSNLKIQTRTDKLGFYKCLNNSKTFIRLKNGGDAIALSVLEALAHGCKVVWNVEFEHCYYETRESFKKNYKNYFDDNFNINYSAINYVKQTYDVKMWKEQFKKIVMELMNGK